MVPTSWRCNIFQAIHDLSHPSIGATRKLVAATFVWKGISKQVREWAKACVSYQLSKVQRHVKDTLETFEVPHRHFEYIHVDLVGPLPQSQGFTYLFTIVDRFTHWPEAVPLMDMTTLSCAWALIATWITKFGVPSHISSDRGSEFTYELWTAVCQLLGTQYHCTTAYHPQANGLVEQFHHHLKTAMHAKLHSPN